MCVCTCECDAESSATSLYTGAKSNLRDRVLGEVEKNSFTALPGKGGHSGLMPSKPVSPLRDDSDKFYRKRGCDQLMDIFRWVGGEVSGVGGNNINLQV